MHMTVAAILTVLANQNGRAVATRLHIHHNAGILLGKVHQMVFDKVSGIDDIRKTLLIDTLCLLFSSAYRMPRLEPLFLQNFSVMRCSWHT